MDDCKKYKLLVINPNSTLSMTKSLEVMLGSHGSFDNYEISYTQPSTGPPSINNDQDAAESLTHCIVHLSADETFTSYDAYLVACYSDHPLVPWLRSQPSISSSRKPVLGIFEASVIKSLSHLEKGQRFGIVSTGTVWEELLTNAVQRHDASNTEEARMAGSWDRFAGVETTGLNATELHDAPQEQVRERMKDATKRLVKKAKVGAVCLGCAGMAGMDNTVREALREEMGSQGDKVAIVDGVLAGVQILGECLESER